MKNLNLTARYNTKLSTKGTVEIAFIDENTKKVISTVKQDNLITYAAADVMAKLLAGNEDYKIGAVYLEFANAAYTVPSNPNRADTTSYFTTSVVTAGGDYLRIPLIAGAAFSSSDEDLYDYNKAEFFIMTTGGSVGEETSLAWGNTSTVYGLGLIVTPDINDSSEDILFSRLKLSFPFAKPSGLQLGARWTIEFD